MNDFFTDAELVEFQKELAKIFGQHSFVTQGQSSPDRSAPMLQTCTIPKSILDQFSISQITPQHTTKETLNMTQAKLAGVINLDSLTVNPRFNQHVAAAGMKVLHADEQAAIKEAERLAQANPGARFGVFTLTAVSQVQKSVTQRV